MTQKRFVKEYLVDYSWFNHGKSGRQAKRNRKIGQHIIRQKLKRELMKEIEFEMSE